MMTMNWAAAIRPRASQRRRLGVPADVVELMMVPFRGLGTAGDGGCGREFHGDCCPLPVSLLSAPDPVDVEARPLQRG